MKRDSIIFYRSFYEAITELPIDIQGSIYTAIFEYSLNFNEVVLEGLPKTIFTLIKPQLDANNNRYKNGLKGGRTKQEETKTEPKPNQKETKAKANKNENVNYNVNENENENGNNTPPTAFSFYKALISNGAESKLANEWLEVRKKKKSTNSETAFEGFLREMNKGGLDINSALRICIEKSWSGLNANWLKDEIVKSVIPENETAEEKDLRIRIESFKKIKVH